MSYSINGIEAVAKKLQSLEDVEKMGKNMQKACALVEREAKKKAIKDTGELRRSITSKVDIEAGIVNGVVFTPLLYAPYVEYGTGIFAEVEGRKDVPWNYQDDKGEWHSTSGMKPQPFMRPALDENKEKVLEILKRGITEND